MLATGAGGPGVIGAVPADRFGSLRRIRAAEVASYDVVIIGGGVHGLATAYELAKRGVKDVAVLESLVHRLGRERPQHGDHPLELPHDPGRRVLRRVGAASTSGSRWSSGFNVLFSQHGHLTLRAHGARRSPACGSGPRRTS